MRHIEGFVDKQTYFSEGHIWCITMEYGEQLCYVWLVLKDNAANGKEIEALLQKWAGRELVHALEHGCIAVQREVNRFESLFLGHISPALCVYYQGHIFVGCEGHGALKCFQKPWGMYVSSELVGLLTEQEKAAKNIEYNCFSDFLDYSTYSMEEKAHFLNKLMLKAISEGKLEQGYFFLWEDLLCLK